jgi:hypothetical protein
MRGPSVTISFRPHSGLLTQTRDFVSSFCATFVQDPDVVYRIAIAVHELLENAIKYSSDGTTLLTIELENEEIPSRISICVENAAMPSHVASVRNAIDRIHEADDPFELYCELIRSSAGHANSGLGLARISAEAACDLDYAIVGERVSLFARTSVGPEFE